MKELGGYFELEYGIHPEYHQSAVALNSGRHCLEYLIKAKKITKLYLPSYLCSCIETTCKKNNCSISYYEIDNEFMPIFEDTLFDHEYLYIVNYFGQLSNHKLNVLKEKYTNIIVDNAQSFFQIPISNTDTLYTCRKYFGVADGGYLYTDKVLEDELPIDLSYERMEFVLGRFELSASTFYKLAADNNDVFDKECLKAMSKLTHNILKSIDYNRVIEIRNHNFLNLHSSLSKENRLNLLVPKGPYMYPYYCKEGQKLKQFLISRKVYVPTLWPDVFDRVPKASISYEYALNIVPLPCDQRYTTNDMDYIIQLIEQFNKERKLIP